MALTMSQTCKVHNPSRVGADVPALSSLHRPSCIQNPIPDISASSEIVLIRFVSAIDNKREQIAVISATPWDSYLIRRKIWTYPPNVVLGPTFFKIPIEEVFFFVIQTYLTSLLYLIVSKPTCHPVYLQGTKSLHNNPWVNRWRWLGTLIIVLGVAIGGVMVADEGKALYLGLIITWAGPFILLLWWVSLALH